MPVANYDIKFVTILDQQLVALLSLLFNDQMQS